MQSEQVTPYRQPKNDLNDKETSSQFWEKNEQNSLCSSDRSLTNPATFFIIEAGFELNPFTSATISCLSMESFLSFSKSTRITSALRPSTPKE